MIQIRGHQYPECHSVAKDKKYFVPAGDGGEGHSNPHSRGATECTPNTMRQRLHYIHKLEDEPHCQGKVHDAVLLRHAFGALQDLSWNLYGHQLVCCSADKYNLKIVLQGLTTSSSSQICC